MTAVLLPEGRQQFFTTAGVPAVGYKLQTWAAGTSTPQATWADALKIATNPNPIILDGRGEAVIFWDGVYKIQLLDATGAPVSAPVDNVTSAPTSSASFIPSVDNTLTLGSPSFSWANLYLGPGDAAAYDSVSGNIAYFARNSAEIAAGVTPINYGYLPGDIRRYGATLNGVTDDTVAVQRWLNVGGALTFPVALTALITSACTIPSNTNITAAKGATISTAVGGFSLFTATGKSSITVDGLTFQNTHAGAAFATTFAHVQFFTCTRTIVRNCEFIGMQCGGIEFDGCTAPAADNNYFHNGLYVSGQTQIADIALYGFTGATTQAVITNNQCYGGGAVGIASQNEYVASFNPSKNVISGNRIGNCLLYGILCYKPSYMALNSYDQIVNNYIENVQGIPALLSGQGGAGIYVVGAASGGTLISGNQIVNCCVQTTGASQSTGGISISGTNGAIFFTASVGGATSGTLGNGGSPFVNGNWNGASGNYVVNFSDGEQRVVTLTNGATTCTWSGALSAGTILTATLAAFYNDPLSVANNKVSGMTQYDGIQVSSSLGSGVALSNNTVNMPVNTTGFALHIRNSSNVTVVGGVLVNQGTGQTVFIENQTAVQNLTLKGTNINGGGNAASTGCVQIVGDGTHGIAGLTLSGLQIVPAQGGAGAAALYMTTAAVSGAQISDCYANVATMPALLVAGCTGIRVSNSTLASTGTNTVTTSGNCAGSFFDKSNVVSGGVMNNGATGFHADQFGAAAPGTGTWAKGDCIYNDFSATNVNAVFMCTVAGSPGTFVGHV